MARHFSHSRVHLFYSFVQYPRRYEEFNYFYTSFYIRIPPYLTGFMAACIAKGLIKRNYKFSTVRISHSFCQISSILIRKTYVGFCSLLEIYLSSVCALETLLFISCLVSTHTALCFSRYVPDVDT